MTTKVENGVIKQIVCGVIIVLLSSWIAYATVKGLTLDVRVSVLESIASTIREDIRDIKLILTEVRQDQKRRESREN